MPIEHLLDSYTTTGDMISFITCVTLLFIIHTVLFFSHDSKFSFLKRAIHFIMFGSFANIMFWLVCRTYNGNDFLIFALRTVYHSCFMCCMYLFLLYLKRMLAVRGAVESTVVIFTRVIFLVALITDALSPITKFGFHKEGDLWYDPMISPYNGFYLYGVTLLFIMMVRYADRLIRTVRVCLLITELIIMIVMVKSAIDNYNTFTSFTYVIPIIVVMILLHSRPFDDQTGAMSGDSFDNFINAETKKGVSFDYLILKLNLNVINKVPAELGKVLNSFWHADFKNALLFRVEHDLYVLAIPRVSANGATEEKARTLVASQFGQYYSKFQLQYKIIGLFDIDFIRNDTDIKGIIQYLLMTMQDNTILMSDDKLRDQLRLLREVKDNLADIEKKNDPDDPRVLAFCQPIRNMMTGKFDTGEALMRLNIPEKGMIMPYMFISVAESYGYIHSLTKIMLNKVCRQIKELESEGYDFKRISVNFAASEIRSDGFVDELLEIIRSNGVDPKKIGIEMTESQNDMDFGIIKEKIQLLNEQDMTLYLDDVGTGYSNIDRIVRYDVDVVKFDRFFLVEAEKNPKVIPMIRHLAEAFKDLNYTLLFEGVEDEKDEDLCLSCGAKYIQGFKYSKPLPIEEMRNFFEKK